MGADVKTVELKKPSSAVSSIEKEPAFSMSSALDFVGEVKQELFRINWTTWPELQAYTKVVVAGTFIFGMGIYLMDVVIQMTLGSLEWVIRTLAG